MRGGSFPRVVIDTNVYISQILNYRSIPSLAVLRAEESAEILISKAISDELSEVLRRPKLQRYLSLAVRDAALAHILSVATLIEPVQSVRACRDPRDDKFLEVAVHGRADAIISGDLDLLALNPFRGIAILTPADYLGLKQGGV